MKPDLLRRQEALQKTLAKFAGKPLVLGKSDCAHMARSHLVAMGHRGLPKIGRYSTPAGARRALRATGFDTLEDLFDSLLPRIAPAAMLPGDLLLVEGKDGSGTAEALMISVGRKWAGWHEDATAMVFIEPLIAPRSAWRA